MPSNHAVHVKVPQSSMPNLETGGWLRHIRTRLINLVQLIKAAFLAARGDNFSRCIVLYHIRSPREFYVNFLFADVTHEKEVYYVVRYTEHVGYKYLVFSTHLLHQHPARPGKRFEGCAKLLSTVRAF